MFSQFLWARSPGRGKAAIKILAIAGFSPGGSSGEVLTAKLTWWQDSAPCGYRAKGLASCWMSSEGDPQLLVAAYSFFHMASQCGPLFL